ncbi:MAG TPA: CocE/NonD family hydrolase [Actinomycetota bacterium]|nr:CocE/NonD family hydrolase [Actinomycetota bacterium]
MTHARRAGGLLALTTAALLLVGLTSPARSAPPYDGAQWTEHYFPSVDGITMLHADVLRPAKLSDKAKTPVILTVSPYTNHSGQTTDYNPNASGPSDRFYDFLEVSDILSNGYTYVMVDLPGFGGSGGCNDWGGPAEQGAVKAAVEWAASQPWSTGKVGLMGKSYDGWTGLMGMAQKPKGLAAVVAMEPVYSGYRYLYNNGVRFLNSVATPVGFSAYDAKPGTLQDEPIYHVNSAPLAFCYPVNIALQQQDDPDSAFWAERDLLRTTKKSKVPLFLTQGFLETNTKPDGAFDFFNALAGPNRAWYGQFDHVRGWELQGKEFATGRSVFAAEMMRFFDHYVKGLPLAQAAVHKDSPVAVQDNLGRYRGEPSWPPPDARVVWNKLQGGTYPDNGQNRAYGPSSTGLGVWTFSQPLPHDVWMAGEPVLKVELDALPRANLVANVYDVKADGTATMVSRGAHLVRGPGAQEIELELYGQDWLFSKGHRIGVLISGANAEWWTHIPTRSTVTVSSAQIGIPFLTWERHAFLDGERTQRLTEYLASAIATVAPDTIKSAQQKFRLPPRLLTPRGR